MNNYIKGKEKTQFRYLICVSRTAVRIGFLEETYTSAEGGVVNLRVGILDGEFQDANAVVAISTADGTAVGMYIIMTGLCLILQCIVYTHAATLINI